MPAPPIRSANKNTSGLACETCGLEITPGIRYQVVARQGRRGTVVRCFQHRITEESLTIVVHWNGHTIPVRLTDRGGRVDVTRAR